MLPFLKSTDTVTLNNTGVHPAALESTSPETAIQAVFSANGHRAGVWECSAGKYRLERATDEFFVLLSGHWTLTGDEGDVYDVKAGDALLLRKGWKGVAEIHETIRKVYITWD